MTRVAAALCCVLAAGLLAGPADAFSFPSAVRDRAKTFPGSDRAAAERLVHLCLDHVDGLSPLPLSELRPADGAVAASIRTARGGEVWRPLFGDVLLHQGPGHTCTVYAPAADPRTFAWWLERWSNGPDGRDWQGKWFGRIDGTAWRRFRKRGGGDVHIIAVTGAERTGGLVEISRRSWRESGGR